MSVAINLRPGNVVFFENQLLSVVSTEHVKPGKGPAYIQAEFKNIYSGNKINKRLRSDEPMEIKNNETRKATYLYKSGDKIEVMTNDTFEQISLPITLLNADPAFLKDEIILDLYFIDEDVISVNFPMTESYKIEHSNGKTAVLTNGISISHVPEFITDGTNVIVNILERKYVEKAK